MTAKLKAIIRIVFLVSLTTIVGCKEQDVKIPEARPVAVRVVKPVEKTLNKKIPYLGTVHSKHEVKVIAQIQGTISSMPVEEGMSINKGDIVAKIDAPDLLASVERITVDRDYWKRRYEADNRLVESNALPAEQAEASLRAFNTAQAALDEIHARAAKTREESPVTGIVLRWLTEPGQNVMPGQPIVLLGDEDLEIHVEVVEEDIAHSLRIGLPVEIIDKKSSVVTSSITEIAPVASGPSRTFTVTVPLEKRSQSFQLRGSSVRTNFVVDSQNGITVPQEAVFERDHESFIYLVRQDRAVLQSVAAGITQNGKTLVDFSWNKEDLVVVTNLNSLHDGDSVFSVQVVGVTP